MSETVSVTTPQGGVVEGTPAAVPTPAPRTPAAPQGDPAEGWKALLAKANNDAALVAQRLYDDNQKLRVKLRAAKGAAKPEDGIVLQGDDVPAWTAYRALGKADDLAAAVKELDRIRGEIDGIRKAESHKLIAAAHGYKAGVLSRLIDQEHLDVSLEDDPKTGKPAARVKGANAQGKEEWTPLPDYLGAHPVLKDYLPALTLEPPSRAAPGTPTRAAAGAPPPAPNPASTAPRASLVNW